MRTDLPRKLFATLLGPLALAGAAFGFQAEDVGPDEAQDGLRIVPCPNGGSLPSLQIDGDGVVHLVYFKGEPSGGDLYYATSEDGGESFSDGQRVNDTAGSVDGSSRTCGGNLALDADGGLHVVWLGSPAAEPRGPNREAPALYARRPSGAEAFEAARGLVGSRFGLEAAPGIAAGDGGLLYVAWNAPDDDGLRRVWLVSSTDGGDSFSAEREIDSKTQGASAKCNVAVGVEHDGTLYAVYRTFHKKNRRDVRMLASTEEGADYTSTPIGSWRSVREPVTLAFTKRSPRHMVAAWEVEDGVLCSVVDKRKHAISLPVDSTSSETWRRSPAGSTNLRRALMLTWIEGPRDSEPTRLGWKTIDMDTRQTAARGRKEEVTPRARPDIVALPDDSFLIVY